MTFLAVLGGIVALGLGIWLGMPASSRQSELDSRKAFEEGGGQRRKASRQPMWIETLRVKTQQSKLRDRGRRGPFDLDRSDR